MISKAIITIGSNFFLICNVREDEVHLRYASARNVKLRRDLISIVDSLYFNIISYLVQKLIFWMQGNKLHLNNLLATYVHHSLLLVKYENSYRGCILCIKLL